jgi:hypothetical protein
MALTNTQIPPDSTGDKLDMRSLVRGADTLLQQGVYFPGLPTYWALSAAITPAANKYHILIRNDSGSAQSLYLLGLYYYNGLTAVTGVVNEYRFQRQGYGTPAGGAAITADPNNSADPALANVSIYGGATSGVGTDGAIRRYLNVSTEEHTAAVGNLDRLLEDTNKLSLPGPWSRPFVLRPGEAAAVKQIGSGTVGSLRWAIEFAVEPD